MDRALTNTSSSPFSDLVRELFEHCAPDEQLDFLTRDAAITFKVPYALINYMADEELIIKSCAGLNQGEKLKRQDTFCSQTVLVDEVVMVPDATKDDRFKALPLVVGPLQIRSYVGKAMHASDGTTIGTFCLMDTVPRVYSDAEIHTLRQFTARAEACLADLSAYYKISNKSLLA